MRGNATAATKNAAGPGGYFGPANVFDSRGRRTPFEYDSTVDRESWLHATTGRQRLVLRVLWYGTFAFIFSWVLGILVLWNKLGMRGNSWLLTNVLIFFLFTVPFAAIFASERLKKRRIVFPTLANLRLSKGICGGCKYSLVGIAQDVNEGTVCPECGAAWKLNAPLSERDSA